MNTFSNQFYNRDPARYRTECTAVQRLLRSMNPQLIQLKDGRRGFIMTFTIPDPKGDSLMPDGTHCKRYTALGAWNADHPYSASHNFGGSVRWYLISPSMSEMETEFRQSAGRSCPHLLNDVHPRTGSPIHIPCTQKLGKEDNTFTIVEAATLLNNWLVAYTAAKYRPAACRAFCEE